MIKPRTCEICGKGLGSTSGLSYAMAPSGVHFCSHKCMDEYKKRVGHKK